MGISCPDKAIKTKKHDESLFNKLHKSAMWFSLCKWNIDTEWMTSIMDRFTYMESHEARAGTSLPSVTAQWNLFDQRVTNEVLYHAHSHYCPVTVTQPHPGPGHMASAKLLPNCVRAAFLPFVTFKLMVMEAIGCLLIDPFFMARIFISQKTQERYIICNFFPETEFSRWCR